MTKPVATPAQLSPSVVLVTGPSGAGRSTAINALEDLGFEVIDNLPLSLLPRLLSGPAPARPLALGLDARNRDFGGAALAESIDRVAALVGVSAQVLYLDASEEELIRRYSETRRRHPLAPDGTPAEGIGKELALLADIRARADFLISTTGMSPHDLKAEIGRWFGGAETGQLSVSVQSFSYKRGLPRGIDIVLDCRFLRNPHWDEALRPQDGRDRAVADYVEADPRFDAFFAQTTSLLELLLPAYQEEGKAHLSIGFGCTGGRHRSVMMAERMTQALAQQGWHVSKRHRELERLTAQVGKERQA
ncbi:RNase adapter RapZ [Yoonia litorea]|uniref:UPF0042 nucleotide-binding protein n=1 Tax=Yoonia litorea TaxID=1123755 RepID=A0A1I6MXX3_9RHOB|nr:RNase adapter RapZ [Yoonia litorea]SFS20471.1 UPF0042 nucleotide-binding protein [Yoonia litorea]